MMVFSNRLGGSGLVVFLLVGMLVGNAVGHVLGKILPAQHILQTVFVRTFSIGVEQFSVDLAVFSFALGFQIDINFISFLAMAAAGYYWKYAY